jgi:hypothetical protein
MGSQQKKKGGAVKRMKVAAATIDVTMDVDLLDCPVCCYPMRPPVFQVPSSVLILLGTYKAPHGRNRFIQLSCLGD